MNKRLNDIFTFDNDYDTEGYVAELQETIDKLYDLVNHAGDFVSDDVELTQRINDIIFASMNK